jgi:hypothetical protein
LTLLTKSIYLAGYSSIFIFGAKKFTRLLTFTIFAGRFRGALALVAKDKVSPTVNCGDMHIRLGSIDSFATGLIVFLLRANALMVALGLLLDLKAMCVSRNILQESRATASSRPRTTSVSPLSTRPSKFRKI